MCVCVQIRKNLEEETRNSKTVKGIKEDEIKEDESTRSWKRKGKGWKRNGKGRKMNGKWWKRNGKGRRGNGKGRKRNRKDWKRSIKGLKRSSKALKRNTKGWKRSIVNGARKSWEDGITSKEERRKRRWRRNVNGKRCEERKDERQKGWETNEGKLENVWENRVENSEGFWRNGNSQKWDSPKLLVRFNELNEFQRWKDGTMLYAF